MEQITVCIPSLPERALMRRRVRASIAAQTLQPTEVLVLIDHGREGEIPTRNKLLASVRTPWIAWIDDDDEMMPRHLELLQAASENADLIYSDYESIGANYRASFIEPAYLCRTEMLRSVGGFPDPEGDDWPYRYGDWGLLAKLLVCGYRFRHVPQVTWQKHIHDMNICGTGF